MRAVKTIRAPVHGFPYPLPSSLKYFNKETELSDSLQLLWTPRQRCCDVTRGKPLQSYTEVNLTESFMQIVRMFSAVPLWTTRTYRIFWQAFRSSVRAKSSYKWHDENSSVQTFFSLKHTSNIPPRKPFKKIKWFIVDIIMIPTPVWPDFDKCCCRLPYVKADFIDLKIFIFWLIGQFNLAHWFWFVVFSCFCQWGKQENLHE